MMCRRCGKNPAEVHIVEVVEGRRRSLWLCAECAETENWRGGPGASGGEEAGPDWGDQFSLGGDPAPLEGETLAGFLGRPGPDQAGQPDDQDACPQCGRTWARFQETSRVGCARCYLTFRAKLLPLMANFHRHATHLGRVPASGRDRDSLTAERTRLRIEMEKAIAREEFEAAAALRDRLRRLESGSEQEGDPE